MAASIGMRTRRGAALLCMALALCPAASSAGRDEVSKHLAAGTEAAQQGRYASAKAEFEAAIALDPNRPDARYDLGLLYGQLAEYPAAERAFRQALRLDPNSAPAHCRLGQTLVADPHANQDWAAAVTEFREAIRLQPNYPEAESFLGLGLINLGETDRAIATLQHAIQLDPNLAAAHLNLATALEAASRLDEAAKQYQAALQSKPDAPNTEATLATLYVHVGQPALAEQHFRDALRLNPDLPNAHYGLARLLKSGKQTEQAAVEFSEAQALDQREPDRVQALTLSNRSLQLAAKGDFAGAIDLLHRSLLLKPDYGAAHDNLGLILADSGDFPAAKDELVDAVSLLPTEPRIWFNLGRVLRKLGDLRGALEAVSWAQSLSPANPSFVAEIQALQTANPTMEPAAPAHRQPDFGALSDTAPAHLAFASQLTARRNFSGAIGELLRALTLQPGSLEARRTLAEDYVSLAQWSSAFLEYHKLLLVTGEDAGIHVALGKILLAQANSPQAVAEFRLALAQQPTSAAARAGLDRALHSVAVPQSSLR